MKKYVKGWLLPLVVSALSMGGLAGCNDSDASLHQSQPTTPLHYLSQDGVGPINAATPFNLRLIGDAFQGLNVTEETHFIEGDKYPVITIKQRSKPLLTINPDHEQHKVFSVMVHDNYIGNRLAHKIGTKFVDIYPADKVEECVAGMDELAGKVLCRAPNSANILYLFNGKWEGASNTVPPLPVLANWQIESFIWKPPLQTASTPPQSTFPDPAN
ncbi:DUF1131 family protein [Thiofilum flexile]|uniref:DUF1131 family protein n=1 Tax=Thiofilum flexile TaxID=125627 RepID=UPI00035FD789|nr:DUF1131 family protein [Thiofilum flexile]